MSAEAANLVRAFYAFSAGRDLVPALEEPAFIEAGHAAFDHLMAPQFEFVLVRGDVGEQGIYRGRNALETYLQPSAALAALAEHEREKLTAPERALLLD